MKVWTKLASAVLLGLLAVPGARAQNVEAVLGAMDRAAASFRSTEADFVWDQYTKVVEETDTQKGSVYFRRNGKEIQMAADIVQPETKVVVYSDGQVKMYQPKIDTLTVYNAGKNKTEMESFMVLGFGGRGHELLPSYDVTWGGAETVDGVKTEKLVLVPKLAKTRNVFNKIVLWIDPARGISIRQQLFTPSGDYRLAKYSNIRINQKISDDVYKIKTTSKTKTLTPQG
ncbi:MAG TPA: outer membrane lipoprotein carrier protein LolA [Terriglobales bacterium]|nr:outer membrane lipoprotein carrier protein LolA [Terriglobales bacterium]